MVLKFILVENDMRDLVVILFLLFLLVVDKLGHVCNYIRGPPREGSRRLMSPLIDRGREPSLPGKHSSRGLAAKEGSASDRGRAHRKMAEP
jgi:hypothetical protein